MDTAPAFARDLQGDGTLLGPNHLKVSSRCLCPKFARQIHRAKVGADKQIHAFWQQNGFRSSPDKADGSETGFGVESFSCARRNFVRKELGGRELVRSARFEAGFACGKTQKPSNRVDQQQSRYSKTRSAANEVYPTTPKPICLPNPQPRGSFSLGDEPQTSRFGRHSGNVCPYLGAIWN